MRSCDAHIEPHLCLTPNHSHFLTRTQRECIIHAWSASSIRFQPPYRPERWWKQTQGSEFTSNCPEHGRPRLLRKLTTSPCQHWYSQQYEMAPKNSEKKRFPTTKIWNLDITTLDLSSQCPSLIGNANTRMAIPWSGVVLSSPMRRQRYTQYDDMLTRIWHKAYENVMKTVSTWHLNNIIFVIHPQAG